VPEAPRAGVLLRVVAGVRYEAQKRKRGTEVVRVRLAKLGSFRTPAAIVAHESPGWQALA
jgi:hypothetical protein